MTSLDVIGAAACKVSMEMEARTGWQLTQVRKTGMPMLTEAAIVAIAKAFEAGFNYAAVHEQGMTQAQREQMAQWTIDDVESFRAFFKQIRALLPKPKE